MKFSTATLWTGVLAVSALFTTAADEPAPPTATAARHRELPGSGGCTLDFTSLPAGLSSGTYLTPIKLMDNGGINITVEPEPGCFKEPTGPTYPYIFDTTPPTTCGDTDLAGGGPGSDDGLALIIQDFIPGCIPKACAAGGAFVFEWDDPVTLVDVYLRIMDVDQPFFIFLKLPGQTEFAYHDDISEIPFGDGVHTNVLISTFQVTALKVVTYGKTAIPFISFTYTTAGYECGGDPHFMTWGGQRFNYQGECDLVLSSSKSFQDGKGLDVHVRTKIESVYSIVAAIAIKVDDWVFEFNHETVGSPKFFVNAMELPELPYEEGQFKVSTRDVYNEDYNTAVQIITVAIGSDATFTISVMDQWVHISAEAVSKEVKDSIGLTGKFPKGEMLGRDGADLSHDRDAFGSDWQVQPDEPKLFHSTLEGHPQAPEATCKMPEVDAHQYLRTRNSELYKMAVEACKKEGMSGLDLEDCIFDVSVMNNPKIAAAWWGMEKKE